MRGLALARYHVLSRVRSSYGGFGAALVLAAFPVLVLDTLFISWTDEWRREIELVLALRAVNVHVIYFWHLIVLLGACDLFGTPRQTRDGNRRADLTETVPITPAARFIGDATGIFASVGLIHLCTLPMLALAVALSPLPATVFFRSEAIVLAAIVFGSAAAAWKLYSSGKWMRTRTPRSIALFFILFLGILMFNTKWKTFLRALETALLNPTPSPWNDVRAAVISMPMLVGSLMVLYFGYITYYALSSIRSMEKNHAL